MVLKKITIVLLLLLFLQIVLAPGTTIAENITRGDSDLTITLDRELSSEKQIVVKVADQSKAQRDLKISVPEGTTFNQTESNKLNKQSTYTSVFNEKNSSNQIVLKQANQPANSSKESMTENSKNSSVVTETTNENADKKEYLLVFKVRDINLLVKQQLRVTSVLGGQEVVSSPLLLKDTNKLTTNAEQENSIKKIQLSVNQKQVTVNDNLRLEVNPGNSHSIKTIYLDIDNNGLSFNKLLSDNDGVKIEAQKNAGKNILKISSNTPIDKPFTVLLKANSAGTSKIKIGANSDNIDSNELTIKAVENDTPSVLANNPNLFDDGITNWVKIDDPVISSMSIGPNLELGFTIGPYESSFDPEDVTRNGPNVFLLDSGNYISAFYSPPGIAKSTTTSDSYGAVYDTTSDPDLGEGLDVEASSENSTSASDPTYFKGTDSSGRIVLKKVVNNPHRGFVYQILYRFNNTVPVIQQELYLKNNSDTPLQYGAYINFDTQLNSNDGIPLYAMGNDSGLYMQDDTYKLMMNMNVPDGPSGYVAQHFAHPTFEGFSPENITGKGLESQHLPEGTQVLQGGDSAYTAKWDYHSLAPGGVDHYRTDIGLTKAGYVVPQAEKFYTNKTSQDGKNHVGDKIKFKLSAHNIGYKSSWGSIQFKDIVPKDFIVDKDSIQLTKPDGTTVAVPSSDFDESTNTITVPVGDSLKDNDWAYLTFDSTIASSASGKDIVNQVDVTGIDENAKDQAHNTDASVTVPVEKSPYIATLTKKVKNETNNDPDYVSETTGEYGNKIDYQIKYTVDSNSEKSLASGDIKDQIPAGLEIDNHSIKVTYSDGTTENPNSLDDLKVKALTQGASVTIEFQATVTEKKATTIKNIANFTGKSSDGSSAPDATSEADLNTTAYQPVATIDKAVRVGWTGSGDFQDKVSALPGDEILYRLVVNPDSKDDGILNHLKIKDLLPEGFIPSNNRLALNNTYVTIKDSTGQDIENGVLYFDPSDLATNGGLDIDQIIQANIDDSTISGAPNIKSGDHYEVYIAGNVDDKFFEADDESASQGKHIDNVASVVSSSYGDKEVTSNTAVINVSPLKTDITKEVKEASDQDSQYSKHDSAPLSTVIGDKLNYRVTVKPDQSTSRATLSDLTIQDDFNGNLGTNLTLNGAEVHYYDQDNNEYPDKTEKYTAKQLEDNQYKISLQSNLKSSDYVQIVYDVTVMDNAQTDKVLSNTAYIVGSSYGLNNNDNKRDGWYSNDSNIQVSALGTIVIRYADRETNALIKEATDDKTGKESFTDRIGRDKKVQPKDLGTLGYTVVDSSAVDSSDDAIGDIKDWKQPAVDYDLKFDHDVQVITYRYEKSRIGLVAPVLWDFGKFSTSAIDQTYYLKSHQKQADGTKKPQSVDVIDYYTAKNWTLSVKQLGQFKGSITTHNPSTGQENTKDYYLDNTQLHLNNGNVTLTDNDEVAENNLGKLTNFGDQTLDPKATQNTALMTTEFAGDDSSDKNDGHDGQYATHGFGTWHYNFGDQETADHSIGLHVPKTTKRHQTKYKTKLEWTLSVAE